MPKDIPIAVSELQTDEKPKVAKNAIIIAMTRDDAGFLKGVLRYYLEHNETGKDTRQLCEELLNRMNECFPRPPG